MNKSKFVRKTSAKREAGYRERKLVEGSSNIMTYLKREKGREAKLPQGGVAEALKLPYSANFPKVTSLIEKSGTP